MTFPDARMLIFHNVDFLKIGVIEYNWESMYP